MSSPEVETNPRKLPRQARSRATVDAMLEAAAQVLVEHGYEGATTARVAERAGVSIGSLYQYFPNKEALIAALVERHAGDLIALAEATVAGPEAATLEGGFRALIRAGMDGHRLAPELHKILVEQVPRVGRVAVAMDTSRRIAEIIERHLRAHRDALPRGFDPVVGAFVIEAALEAIEHRTIISRPAELAARLIEEEAVRLVMGYLGVR